MTEETYAPDLADAIERAYANQQADKEGRPAPWPRAKFVHCAGQLRALKDLTTDDLLAHSVYLDRLRTSEVHRLNKLFYGGATCQE